MLSTLQIWLQVVSLAVAIGGLAIFFIDPEDKKKLAKIIISSLITLTLVILILSFLHYQGVSRVSQDILVLLGKETMTFDQIYQKLWFVEIPIVNEALEKLVESGKIGHRLVQVKDKYGIDYLVLVYFVKN